MAITKICMTNLLVAVTVVASACGGSTPTAPTTTTTTQAITTDVLTGSVAVPVGGVLQSSFNQFIVGQGGGSVDGHA